MIYKKNNSGFTLIELLVVVAIIGILVAIVTVSLDNAKKRGNDAAVKTNLNTIRGVSGIFYSDNGNSFLPAGGSTFGINTCPGYNAVGTDMVSQNKTIASAIAEATLRGVGNSCYNSPTVWAVAVGLKSGGIAGDAIPDSWCVDSGGAGKSYVWATGESIANSINVTFCK